MTRPVLRYFGGKSALAPWVIEHFPAHDVYVEPFGGAASVLFAKRPSRIEVWNDLYDEVVHFFEVLRTSPDELIFGIACTPWHRTEFERASLPTEDPIERARRFYVRSWQGFAGEGSRKRLQTGWRRSRTRPPQGSFADAETLYAAAQRLRSVQCESRDALSIIEDFDGADTLFYVDPPYLLETRGARYPSEYYMCELTGSDHHHLLEVLAACEGRIVLSGYDSPLYNDILNGWQRVHTRSVRVDGSSAVETLWLSPNIRRAVQGELLGGRHDTTQR